MNISAIYHQSYDNFCYALDEENILITLQTGKDVTAVNIIWGDPFSRKKVGNTYEWLSSEVPVTERLETQDNYLWRVKIALPFRRCKYYFKVFCNSEVAYYMEDGAKSSGDFLLPNGDAPMMGPDIATFTFPWLNACDVCRTPAWARSSVFYQIFPARFCRVSLPNSDKNEYLPWPATSTPCKAATSYGGNLPGIISKLNYLKDIGITGIYMTPINESPSQHKYDTTDYETVDHNFGTNDDMKALVVAAHKNGIRVIIDCVFNHSGWFFPLWQDVVKNGESSKYAKWFCVNDYNIDVYDDYTKMDNVARGKYHSFAFTDFMPKINTGCAEAAQYLTGLVIKWIKDWDIDGVRLDVANELSHKFLHQLRNACDTAKDDFFIIGEAWHNVQNFLRGDEYSTVMNYPLQNAILAFCSKRTITAKDFEYALNRCYTMYYEAVNSVLFNQLDSHDTVRLVTKLGNKDLARAALAILFMLPGTACIYYGTEIMMEGARDPDCRRAMPWDAVDSGVYNSDIDFMRSLVTLRKNNSACVSCDIKFLYDYGGCDNRIFHIKKGGSLDLVVNLSGDVIDTGVKTVILSNAFSDGKLSSGGFIIY